MSGEALALAGLLSPFAVYVYVRVGTAAYFRSKREFDSQPTQRK